MNFHLFLTRMEKLFQVVQSPRLLKALLCHRVLAGAEHRQVLTTDMATVVDIGANRGQFALAAMQWAPRARVIAFEPLPNAAGMFRKVFQGESKVILHQIAIGSTAGESTIHVSAADDSSSLLPISTLQQRLFPGTGEVRTASVTVGRLANFIAAKEIVAPAFLKLDVQGYELEVLRGCEDLLGCFSHVYVECSFMELYHGQALADEIINYLWKRGFRMIGVYNLNYEMNGKTIQGDFMFKKT